MPSITLTTNISIGGDTKSGKIVLTGSGGILDDVALSASQANQEVIVAFKQTDLTAGCLAFFSDQAVTVKTNSHTSPDDTFNVPAGGSVIVLALAADVTALYLTNVSTTNVANVSIRGVANVTP